MAVPFFKILKYAFLGSYTYGGLVSPSAGFGPAEEITDCTEITTKMGLEAKTNMCTFNFMNDYNKHANPGDNRNPFDIKYNDLIEVYISHSPIDTNYKGNSSQLLFRGFVQEITPIISEGKRDLKVKCVDETSLLLNRVWSFSYSKDLGYTPPQLVQKICRDNTDQDEVLKYHVRAYLTNGQNYNGDYDVTSTLVGNLGLTGGTDTVDSKDAVKVADSSDYEDIGIVTIDDEQIEYEYISGDYLVGITRAANGSTAATHKTGTNVYASGYIQTFTQPTSGNDHLKDGRQFTVTALDSNFVPVYEWLKKVSYKFLLVASGQTEPEARSYTFYLDRFRYLHWFYPYNGADYNLTEGQDRITQIQIGKTLIKSYNMIIYDAGNDPSGTRMISYYFNENTTDRELKMKFSAYCDISNSLRDTEKANFIDSTRWSGGTAAAVVNYKIDNAYPDTWPSNYKAEWDTDFVTYTNATYKIAYRDYCLKTLGLGKAKTETQQGTLPLWEGTITLLGESSYNAGDCVNINAPSHGLVNQHLRVTDVTHKLSKSGWTVTLEMQQDPVETNYLW